MPQPVPKPGLGPKYTYTTYPTAFGPERDYAGNILSPGGTGTGTIGTRVPNTPNYGQSPYHANEEALAKRDLTGITLRPENVHPNTGVTPSSIGTPGVPLQTPNPTGLPQVQRPHPLNYAHSVATYDPWNRQFPTPQGSNFGQYLRSNPGAIQWLLNRFNQGR
jgi:hypothetical protein